MQFESENREILWYGWITPLTNKNSQL